MSETIFVPCPECGHDVINGKETQVTVKTGTFEFGGKRAEMTVPGRVCPNCKEEVAL